VTNSPTMMMVVAAAFCRPDGLWLMHRRPENKQHGGLWEFPGGKVENGETAPIALVREVREELGIVAITDALRPLAFAQNEGDRAHPPIVILLYRIDDWTGEPIAMEGGQVGWFSISEIEELPKPPLDCDLVRQLFPRYVENS